jgi:hypothetical protein
MLEAADEVPNAFLRFARPLLDAAKHFVFFAFLEGEVIIGELAVLLFQLPFDFIPVAFDVEFGHGGVVLFGPLD